jgi:hypothetical protein
MPAFGSLRCREDHALGNPASSTLAPCSLGSMSILDIEKKISSPAKNTRKGLPTLPIFPNALRTEQLLWAGLHIHFLFIAAQLR